VSYRPCSLPCTHSVLSMSSQLDQMASRRRPTAIGIMRDPISAWQQVCRHACCIFASFIHGLMANAKPHIIPSDAAGGDTRYVSWEPSLVGLHTTIPWPCCPNLNCRSSCFLQLFCDWCCDKPPTSCYILIPPCWEWVKGLRASSASSVELMSLENTLHTHQSPLQAN